MAEYDRNRKRNSRAYIYVLFERMHAVLKYPEAVFTICLQPVLMKRRQTVLMECQAGKYQWKEVFIIFAPTWGIYFVAIFTYGYITVIYIF